MTKVASYDKCGSTEYLIQKSNGELLSRSKNADEAARIFTICLDNIPPGHPAPEIYMRQGTQLLPVF